MKHSDSTGLQRLTAHGSRLTVLAAINIFCLAAFFAGGVRAQSNVNVPLGTAGGYFNEPSIAIRPWDGFGNIDGKTIVVSGQQMQANPAEDGSNLPFGSDFYWADNQTYTSKSTDGGITWSTQPNITPPTELVVDDVSAQMYGAADAQLAYRQGSSEPQLLCAYSSYWDDDADPDDAPLHYGGVFLNFSSNDGSSWEATTELDYNFLPTDGFATRPLIATDLNACSNYTNNAYVCWTRASHGESTTDNTEVRVASVTPTSGYSIAHAWTVATGNTSSNLYVDACAISVASDGTVFILWDERNTTSSPYTRDLFITTSTDGGNTWNTGSPITVATGLIAPDVSMPYDGFLGGPSDPYPVPCTLPCVGGPGSPGGINVLNYQDYPSMTISKNGSTETVYIAYTAGYSAIPMVTPSDIFLTSASVSSIETNTASWSTTSALDQIPTSTSGTSDNTAFSLQFQPALCPNGTGGVYLLYYSQQILPTPPPTLLPANPVEVPVIYESSSATQTVISTPIPAFSNEESKFGTGVGDYIGIAWNPILGVAHPVWTDFNSTTSALGIFTTTFPALGGSTNPAIGDLGWSCQRKVAMTGSIAHAVTLNYEYGSPPQPLFFGTSIEYSENFGGASAGWTDPMRLDIPTSDDPLYEPPCIASYYYGSSPHLSAVAACWGDANDGGCHVRVKEGPFDWSQDFYFTSTDCICRPVITPLTWGNGSNDRCLIGWVITWEDWSNHINSRTLLRGPQDPESQITHNENWGCYSEYNFTDVKHILTGVNPNGHYEALSVTANENNGGASDYSNEIIYTSDGTTSGVKFINAIYNVTGSSLGDWSSNTNLPPTIAPTITSQYDENPSVTVTSSGQNIAAWEHMGPGPKRTVFGPPFLSIIRIANTNSSGIWSILQDFITSPANDPSFHWLVNPSVTAFPKTPLLGNADPHGAELLYTQYDLADGEDGVFTNTDPVNKLHERLFDWEYSKPWVGNWTQGDQSPFPFSGVNSQRSFGLYTTGPQYDLIHTPHLLYDEDFTTPYTHGLTYGIGNASRTSYQFATATIGAFKGTFPTPLGEDLYRVEDRYIDTSAVEFQWGGVYVEDTALGMTPREVMLHNGQPDSTGFVSHDAIRDSIFATEWFNWPVSAEITYNRWMGISTGSFTDSVVGTITCPSSSDSSSDSSSTTIYQQVPVYHDSPTHQGDAEFALSPTLAMQYTVQLIHQSGLIDTVDQMLYVPFSGQEITPHTVHIVNANTVADTVMLRVIGNFAGVPDADSNVVFGLEEILDTIGDLGDTTIALGSGGFVPDTGCFEAIGPYPDPSEASGDNVSILVHYCSVGSTITAQVYNIVGGPVGSPVTITSGGQTWDRMDIPAPPSAGAYYIQVSVGAFSSTLGYSVY